MIAAKLPADSFDLGFSLLAGGPFAQPADGGQHPNAAARDEVRIEDLFEWNPIIGLRWVIESRRHNADDSEWLLIERNALPQHSRISAEPFVPQPLAQHHHARLTVPVFCWSKRSPGAGLHTKQREKFVPYARAHDANRFASHTQHRVVLQDRRQMVDGVRSGAPVQIIRIGSAPLVL